MESRKITFTNSAAPYVSLAALQIADSHQTTTLAMPASNYATGQEATEF